MPVILITRNSGGVAAKQATAVPIGRVVAVPRQIGASNSGTVTLVSPLPPLIAVLPPLVAPPPGARFDVLVPASTWIINHNLGKRPQVSVFSVGGREMWAEVIHISDNQVHVYFDTPVSGYTIYSND